MKTIRMEVVIYYEAQDSTTKEEAEDAILDLIEQSGLKYASCKAEVVKDYPNEVQHDSKETQRRT